MWMPGRDASEVTAIKSVNAGSASGMVKVYSQNGTLVYNGLATDMRLPQGIYIIKDGAKASKIAIK